jgi:hypothetical protein
MKLDAALALAARGFHVIPIAADAKFPPLMKDWPGWATSTDGLIADAWERNPDANIGIHCAGMAVIDVDPRKGGDDSFAVLDTIYELPATLTTRTPSGGRHLFYALPDGHPGVPNSVGTLAPGLDVRSTGGYVVAPGSEVATGRYVFEADVPIALAPTWLVERLGEIKLRQSEHLEVPDAPEEVIARATTWLARHEGAIEGQGGDLHTYQTACRLRDFGISEAQALGLMLEWNYTVCLPPWSPEELIRKIQNAYRYAQEEGTKLAVSAVDFPLPADAPVYFEAEMGNEAVPFGPKANLPTGAAPYTGPPGSTRRNKPQRLAEFAADGPATPDYLIKGFLYRQAYGVVYGVRSAGKTFAALDMAYHVAAGLPWMGRKVKQGLVLYLPYEGAGGLRKRAQALRAHYGPADVPFYIQSARYNLRATEGRAALGEAIAALPEKPALIIFDTFAHALCGGDENSAQDVGEFNAGVAALIEHTGACVLVLHHPAKSGNGGPRGSGALPGAIDIELEVVGDGPARVVYSHKQRDTELAEPVPFKLQVVPLGMDDDGDPVTSCVVVPSTMARDAARDLKGGSSAKRVIDVMCELRPDNAPVTELELREACVERFLGKHRGAWHDVRRQLLQSRMITIDAEGMLTRRME